MTARVAVIGNHRHHHCSEAQWARAFEANGCTVIRLQVEDVARDPDAAISVLRTVDLCSYTRTHAPGMFLDTSWTHRWRDLEAHGVRTIGLHLDRFWDLQRENLVHDGDAQFSVGTLWSADGGSEDRWRAAGVQHRWLIPAADADDAAEVGTFDPGVAHDVAFVGSARYHEEYPQRDALIAHLHDVYGPRFAHYGRGGKTNVRGQALKNLLASSKVVIGDSCFANDAPNGTPRRSTNYFSDRVPISLSLGAFFVHPWFPGMAAHFTTGRDLVTHVPGDWEDLDAQIGAYLAAPGERAAIAAEGRRRVLREHTWAARMRDVLCTVGLGDCEEAAA